MLTPLEKSSRKVLNKERQEGRSRISCTWKKNMAWFRIGFVREKHVSCYALIVALSITDEACTKAEMSARRSSSLL